MEANEAKATRAAALEFAIRSSSDETFPSQIVEKARLFEDYLNGNTDPSDQVAS